MSETNHTTTAADVFRLLDLLPDDEHELFVREFRRHHAEAEEARRSAEEEEARRLAECDAFHVAAELQHLLERCVELQAGRRQRDPRTLALADEIEARRRGGSSWRDINGHYRKSARWAQNLLRELGRWPVV